MLNVGIVTLFHIRIKQSVVFNPSCGIVTVTQQQWWRLGTIHIMRIIICTKRNSLDTIILSNIENLQNGKRSVYTIEL